MPGFGSTPFGLSPAGFGAAAGAPAPGASFLRTVDNVLARKLDTLRLDVVVDLDATGAPHEDWDPLYQQVIFALTTPRGSLPFDTERGNEWLLLDRAPLDLAGFGDRAARTALRELVDAEAVEVLRVEVEQVGGLAIQAVTWLDTRTGRERTTPIRRILAMAQTSTDVPTRDALVAAALRFWQRSLVSLGVSAASARAATAKGTERELSAQAYAQGLEIVLANGRSLEDAAMPDTATGDDLDRICAIYGLTRSAGAGAQGSVTVTCTGSVTYVQDLECVSASTGKRYRVVTSTVTTTGGSVPVVGIDVGTATNLDAGEELTWTSPPSGSATTCEVASGGLVDGADADTDGRLRERLLKLLREPQNGGSWAHYRQWAEDASAAVEDAYVYPAAQGPGTVHLAYTVEGTSDNRYARAGTTALTTLVNDAVIAEQPEYADVTVTTVDHQDTGLALKVTIPEPLTGGGPGGGWVDETTDRWPTALIGAGAVDGVVEVTTVTSSTAFVTNANAEAVDGATVVFFSSTDRVFYEAEVVSHSGAAGARAVVIDRALPTVIVGDYVSPACEQFAAYGETLMGEVALLAPGEKTADASVLPRAFRRPATEDGAPSALTTTQLSALQVAHKEISNAAYFLIDEATPTLPHEPDPPASVTSPPAVIRVSHLALYPTD